MTIRSGDLTSAECQLSQGTGEAGLHLHLGSWERGSAPWQHFEVGLLGSTVDSSPALAKRDQTGQQGEWRGHRARPHKGRRVRIVAIAGARHKAIAN